MRRVMSPVQITRDYALIVAELSRRLVQEDRRGCWHRCLRFLRADLQGRLLYLLAVLPAFPSFVLQDHDGRMSIPMCVDVDADATRTRRRTPVPNLQAGGNLEVLKALITKALLDVEKALKLSVV